MPTRTSNSPPPFTVSDIEIPPFPSPQIFDILPEIYALISRVQLLRQDLDPHSISTPSAIESPLEIKDLPQAAIPIKLKIQKAKATVQALPDIERTTVEQENEIKMLQQTIKGLRMRMAELGRRAGEGLKLGEQEVHDVPMAGVEDGGEAL